jgi:hypothetical protein
MLDILVHTRMVSERVEEVYFWVPVCHKISHIQVYLDTFYHDLGQYHPGEPVQVMNANFLDVRVKYENIKKTINKSQQSSPLNLWLIDKYKFNTCTHTFRHFQLSKKHYLK